MVSAHGILFLLLGAWAALWLGFLIGAVVGDERGVIGYVAAILTLAAGATWLANI